MINSIRIKNFQAHKDSKVEFCDGFNVITGSSDAGKSSIFRAEEWVRINRPSGDAIKNWYSKENESVSVNIDGIIKERAKGKSFYKLNGKKFEAIRTDIPEEVSSALNLSDVNIQTQHESYFLINDSPGEVARKLNDLVGLDIIDRIYKYFNSKSTGIKKDIQSLNDSISELSSDIESMKYLDDAEIEINNLEKEVERYETLNSLVEKIESFLNTLFAIENQERKLKPLLSLKRKVDDLLSLCLEFKESSRRSDRIFTLLNNLKEVEESIESEQNWLTVKALYEDTFSLINQFAIKEKSIKTSLELIKACQIVDDSIQSGLSKLSALKNEYKEKLHEYKICPMCYQKITEKTVKEMFS